MLLEQKHLNDLLAQFGMLLLLQMVKVYRKLTCFCSLEEFFNLLYQSSAFFADPLSRLTIMVGMVPIFHSSGSMERANKLSKVTNWTKYLFVQIKFGTLKPHSGIEREN